tara:strand:+ start:76 stop:990 length:915 start_codon:yes stop_codon:yes gene_type:complete
MEYEFENFGKFIQRVNLSIILFCVFSIITAIQIGQFNKNLSRAEAIKTSIVTSQSSVFEYIEESLRQGSDSPELVWSARLKDDDMRNLINHELEIEMLAQWFDKFWQGEKNQEASGQLQLAFFEISSIAGYAEEIKNITGNSSKTIESSINALDSFLKKREIKSIKLPLLGTEIDVSLLMTVIPVTQSLLLLVVSGYLVIVSNIIVNTSNVKDLLSNTVLYATNYNTKDIYHHIFKFPRLIPSLLMFFTLYIYGLISVFYWQFWLTVVTIALHLVSTLVLDRKILSIVLSSNKSIQPTAEAAAD